MARDALDHAASPLKDAIIEPRAGGRWFERGEDGSECQWGRVLAWEPPHRLVLAWKLNAQWKFDETFVTEVELRFIAEDGGTRVELEHRFLERYAEHARRRRRPRLTRRAGGADCWTASPPRSRGSRP